MHYYFVKTNCLEQKMLRRPHENHYGITKTQQRAKQLLYWPHINSYIGRMVSNCSKCTKFKNNNVNEPLLLRALPKYPFEVVASDTAEFLEKIVFDPN